MEAERGPAPFADVELSLVPDPNLRALVRSVAVEAADPDPGYTREVRETTDTLVCALLEFTQEHSRLRCLFRVLDGEVRIRISLSKPTAERPEAKSRCARLLDRLDVHATMFTSTSETQGTELVCETLAPRTRA